MLDSPHGDFVVGQSLARCLVEGWSCFSMAFAATTSLRAMAMRATFAGFPAARIACYSALNPASQSTAERAAMYNAVRTQGRPHWM